MLGPRVVRDRSFAGSRRRIDRAVVSGLDELQARRVFAIPALFENAPVTGLLDQPFPAGFHILVVVIGADPESGLLGLVQQVVVERPRAPGGGGAGQLDLRMMHLVNANQSRRTAHRAVLEELYDCGAAGESQLPVRVVGGGVGRESGAHLVPLLRIQASEVFVLEPFDRLDVFQGLYSRFEFACTGHLEPSVWYAMRRRGATPFGSLRQFWARAGASAAAISPLDSSRGAIAIFPR